MLADSDENADTPPVHVQLQEIAYTNQYLTRPNVKVIDEAVKRLKQANEPVSFPLSKLKHFSEEWDIPLNKAMIEDFCRAIGIKVNIQE
jgi:hypothetical protein